MDPLEIDRCGHCQEGWQRLTGGRNIQMVIGARLTYTDPPTPLLALKGCSHPLGIHPAHSHQNQTKYWQYHPWHCSPRPASYTRWETMSIWMHDSITGDDISARGYYGIRISRECLKEHGETRSPAEIRRDAMRRCSLTIPLIVTNRRLFYRSSCYLNGVLPMLNEWTGIYVVSGNSIFFYSANGMFSGNVSQVFALISGLQRIDFAATRC